MRKPSRARVLVTSAMVVLVIGASASPAAAESVGVPGADPSSYAPPFGLAFPVEGGGGFGDTFGAIRDGGVRLHHGVDIFAPKSTPVLAAAGGVVTRIDIGSLAGLWVEITHAEGWRTRYLHLNNDEPPPEPECVETPAEGLPAGEVPSDEAPAEEAPVEEAPAEEAPVEEAPAEETVADEVPDEATSETELACPEVTLTTGIPPEVVVGATVSAGEVIGFVGNTGNAMGTSPHLHFEVRMPDGTPVNPHPILTGTSNPRTLYVVPEITDEPVTDGLEFVGHVPLPDGFNSTVWAHDGIVYVATMGNEDVCPATGVRRFDVAGMSEPIAMEAISGDFPGTHVTDLWVGEVVTQAFSGTLAIVALAPCAPESSDDAFGGLVLYDVTDATSPTTLSSYAAGDGTAGVRNFDTLVEEGAVRVIAAVPNSRFDHAAHLGDVRFVDFSDPTAPVDIADWDFRRDAPATMRHAVIADHDLREFGAAGVAFDPEGGRAFIAHGDAGLIVLDLADAARPKMIGRSASLGHQEGNAGSVAFDPSGGVLVVGYEDLDPIEDEILGASWGVDVALDAAGDADPVLLWTYLPDGVAPDPDGRVPLGGLYSPRPAVISDGYLFVPWLSGGLRVVSLTGLDGPVEVASFVPPTKVDPQRRFASPNGNIGMALAWSVYVDEDLIYVSDLNTGLWILRLHEPPLGGR